MNSEGKKFDQGKIRYDLVPQEILEGIALVMTKGAAKYDDYNWQLVELPRYLSALQRHLKAMLSGEKLDPDSGDPHAFHFATNAFFIAWLALNRPDQLKSYWERQSGVAASQQVELPFDSRHVLPGGETTRAVSTPCDQTQSTLAPPRPPETTPEPASVFSIQALWRKELGKTL